MRFQPGVVVVVSLTTPLTGQQSRPIVDPKGVATIIVLPAGDTIDPGECRKFVATAFDGSHRPVSISSFSFGVSDAARLKVDPPSGEVCAGTAVSREATTATVTASLPNNTVTGRAHLVVRARPVPLRRQRPAVPPDPD